MLTPHLVPGTSKRCSMYAYESTRCTQCSKYISSTTESEFNACQDRLAAELEDRRRANTSG